MIRTILFASAMMFTLCCPGQPVATRHMNLTNGLALEGYDPVAYFAEKKAARGNREFSSQYQGATYLFKSLDNKKAFDKEPAAYVPRYGGWCAYAMGASGDKVEVDPETFKIKDGKLYLFYNRFFNNTLTKWNENEARLEQQADRNWIRIINPVTPK